MGAKKKSSKAGKAKKAVSAIGSKLGIKSKATGGRRRSKGPTYWANKVLVERLKKKYHRLKFGGR